MHKQIFTRAIIMAVLVNTSSMYAKGNEVIPNFKVAKKLLYKKIYNTPELRSTFYTKCEYTWKKITKPNGKQLWKQVIDKSSCGYEPRTSTYRANFVEAEHIVPAWVIGHTFKAWRDGDERCIYKYGKKKGEHFKGRKCASLVDDRFNLIQSDLYNLVPSVGEINMDRSNYTFTMIPGEIRRYGDIDIEIDFKHRKVEPPEYTRGKIARTYMYMYKQYNIPISNKQMRLFKAWDKQYPMNDEQKYINSKIQKIQGNQFEY